MKKLNIILAGVSLCLMASCSFKSKDEPAGSHQVGVVSELKIDPTGDSDGDGYLDQEEVNSGKNPFVADLPDLKVRFLQSYKIEVSYHMPDQASYKYVFDTNVESTDPDFKYRVGKVFARGHALKTAASFGKFSSHTAGKIEERDYSWVSYPEIDPKLFNEKAIQFRELLGNGIIIENVKITLTNQARLMESSLYHEIKNLKLNFYFYNNETENYEILSSQAIDRHFQSGVYETFDVVIENAPLSLITEGLLKRGQFIISEIENYDIPEKATDYKTLLSSVKAKSLPVLFETPLEEKLYYVAAASSGISFNNILNTVFDKNFKVESDNLVKIGQFENNLGGFTHLKEVKDKDKLGKWFIMTNELKKNYLDHTYTNSDRMVLAYITGTELSEQQEEVVYTNRVTAKPNKSESIIPLGNISPNSRIDFQLKPFVRYGREIKKMTDGFNNPGGSCGKNCYQQPINCSWEINKYTDYNEMFKFNPDFSGEGEKLDLVVNGEAFQLAKLIKEQKILVNKTNIGYHFTIKDISKIKELNNFEENSIAIRVRAFVGNDFFGVKLVDMGGIWNGVGGCPFTTPAVAEKFQTQISKETRELGEISWLVNDLASRGYPYKFSIQESGTYYQEFSFDVSSMIQNFYN